MARRAFPDKTHVLSESGTVDQAAPAVLPTLVSGALNRRQAREAHLARSA